MAALERLLREWLDYVPEILPVARALEAAASNGDEGGTAWHDRMADLHQVIRQAVERVDRPRAGRRSELSRLRERPAGPYPRGS